MEEVLKPVKRIDVSSSLISISVGTSKKVLARDIKPGVVRMSIRRLTNLGFSFKVTEAGVDDGVIVTRVK